MGGKNVIDGRISLQDLQHWEIGDVIENFGLYSFIFIIPLASLLNHSM